MAQIFKNTCFIAVEHGVSLIKL